MIYGFVAFNAFLIALLFWARRRVQAFLAATPGISTPADLDRFKTLVRQQMYATLVYLPLGLASLAWAVWLGREGNLRDLVVVLAVCGTSVWLAQDSKAVETKARNLPVSDALAGDYQAVAKAWESKLLPSF
jgi:hypothetical protein